MNLISALHDRHRSQKPAPIGGYAAEGSKGGHAKIYKGQNSIERISFGNVYSTL